MEQTHSRKNKCKVEFKGVVNKLLISTLVLTTVLGTASPAFAANEPIGLNDYATAVAYEDGISVSAALSNLNQTIAKLKSEIDKGSISKGSLETLASQLYDLEKSVKSSGETPSNQVIDVINKAESTAKEAKETLTNQLNDLKNSAKGSGQAMDVLSKTESIVQGVNGANAVQAAISVVRESLGISVEEKGFTAQAPTAALTSFSDVTKDKWYYNAVMDMAQRGLIQGTTAPDANGVGFFDAGSKMTKASYITIAVRVAYPDELKNAKGGDYWYSAAYDVAYRHGLILAEDPSMTKTEKDMQALISREEMAMILVRTAHTQGVSTTNWVYPSQIPDYNKIDSYYKDYVRESYALGILNGTGNGFDPLISLDRASASQSFYKLVNPSTRTPLTPDSSKEPSSGGGISWGTLEEKRSHGGFAYEDGILLEEYSRQFETNALSACRFGVDSKGVYVDLAGLKLPDELPEYKYQFVVLAYDSNYDSMIGDCVNRVEQGETKRVYLTDVNNPDKIISSLQDAELVSLTVGVTCPGVGAQFSRTIFSNNKSKAKAESYAGVIEETNLDSTKVWQGIGK